MARQIATVIRVPVEVPLQTAVDIGSLIDVAWRSGSEWEIHFDDSQLRRITNEPNGWCLRVEYLRARDEHWFAVLVQIERFLFRWDRDERP